MPELLISAGESSGDLFASLLVRKVRSLRPGWTFTGIGGDHLAREGVRLFARLEDLAVVGLWEVVGRLPAVLRALRKARETLKEVEGVVLVDYPGFNLQVAGMAKKNDIPVFYYIAPQVWAWGASRMGQIAERVTRMAVVLPFEESLFRRFGVEATFVGHPLLEVMDSCRDLAELGKEFGFEEGPVVGLLPGSRPEEVRRLLPRFLEAMSHVRSEFPQVRGVVAAARGVPDGLFRRARTEGLSVVQGRTYKVMAASDVLLVASGTATLEAAILGIPMVVAYRTSWPSYSVARRVVRVPHIALPNLIAGRPVVPELIQRAASPEHIAREALAILGDRKRREEMREELQVVREKLGSPGASLRTAELLVGMLEGSTQTPPATPLRR
ncbi:MAG TPA: lipid-A-disaccharide synthase [Candidatus Latescibacteria bacterium]|nr:lipid-A-disaccharide synthase [Candidatus Latescibacterota bacterium]